MTVEQFRQSLQANSPPPDLGLALAGLWWDAKGDWTRAHEFAQQDEGSAGSWVHAYLHRKEGDASNAAYWYGRCGRRPSTASLQDEWKEIVTALINQETP
jgi:hypothetical protein